MKIAPIGHKNTRTQDQGRIGQNDQKETILKALFKIAPIRLVINLMTAVLKDCPWHRIQAFSTLPASKSKWEVTFVFLQGAHHNYILFLMIKLNGSPSRSSSIVLDTGWHAISSPHCLHVTEGEVHIACFHSEGAADIIGQISSYPGKYHMNAILYMVPPSSMLTVSEILCKSRPRISWIHTWGNSEHLSSNFEDK